MNHMFGCPVRWSESLQSQCFKTLQAPAGNHYLIGDQMSYHPGWQEGALHSAFHALADIDKRGPRQRRLTSLSTTRKS